jgi:TRAP-type mannitol/chloroaromatic compound transport system permease small subunit
MTHLPFIAAAYSLGVLIPIGFGLAAFQRMTAARRKLAAIDPRVGRAATEARAGGKKSR